jgi:hypothetical protein
MHLFPNGEALGVSNWLGGMAERLVRRDIVKEWAAILFIDLSIPKPAGDISDSPLVASYMAPQRTVVS